MFEFLSSSLFSKFHPHLKRIQAPLLSPPVQIIFSDLQAFRPKMEHFKSMSQKLVDSYQQVRTFPFLGNNQEKKATMTDRQSVVSLESISRPLSSPPHPSTDPSRQSLPFLPGRHPLSETNDGATHPALQRPQPRPGSRPTHKASGHCGPVQRPGMGAFLPRLPPLGGGRGVSSEEDGGGWGPSEGGESHPGEGRDEGGNGVSINRGEVMEGGEASHHPFHSTFLLVSLDY